MPSKKDSTWRQQERTLSPNMVSEIVLQDTTPNHIHINNLGPATLYVSATGIPSPQVYDKKIEPHSEGLLAQQVGVTRFLIYAQGANPNRTKITTFEDTFNPSTLTGGNITVQGGGGGTGGNVTIVGHSVPLPAGANNIGKVEVTKMPEQTFNLATLPAGTNNIGKVDVAKLPALAEGVSHIGSVSIDGGVTITDMPPVQLNGDVTLSDTNFRILSETAYYSHNAAVGTTEVVVTLPFTVKTFKFISNDDPTNDLLLTFNNGTTADAQNGQNSVIVLKAGETLTEFNFTAQSVKMKRSSGNGNVRMLGV